MKYLLILPGVLVLLVLIAVVRTLVSPRKTSDYQPPQTDEAEALRLAGKLSKMIQVDTTSHAGGDDPARFRAFHKTLAELFPRVFSQLEKTEIDGNLLFYWKGRSREKPILLMSHQDVVPAEGTWSHAPFSGDIADGKVWGRGASDTKCSVMAFFEAAEQLLAEGYTPPTDVYLASSCTEEWAGDGAPKLVAELQRRGVELFLVCDEGGAIISEPIGGIPGNFAMVGVFEKGKADVKFTARSNGGHASAPMANSPSARLSAFVTDVEKHDPFRRKFLPEVSAMFARLAPYAPFGLRLVMGNLWLFQPLMKIVLPRVSAQAGAMLHTTIAFTMQSGADAYNVLPQEATLGANMRFIPHQGEQESLAIIRRLAHGQNPMAPDRGHIHHRLIDMGLNQKQAVAALYVISSILGLSAVVLTSSGAIKAMLFLMALAVAAFLASRVIFRRDIDKALQAEKAAAEEKSTETATPAETVPAEPEEESNEEKKEEA